MPGLTRGCGKREDGGIYACCPTSPYGRPIWDFVQDPAHPYNGERFLGIHVAPEAISAAWTGDRILLMDYVSSEDYPSVASFVEEVRRFGLSRRISSKFQWVRLMGKKPWLALIHARAIPTWKWDDDPDNHLVRIPAPCKMKDDTPHRQGCVYTSWLTAPMYHEFEGALRPEIPMPWGSFSPDQIFENWKNEPVDFQEPRDGLLGYGKQGAGIFAVFPIMLFQAVKGLPKDCKFRDSGQLLEVVDE